MFTAIKPLLATCASLNLFLVLNDDDTITVTSIPLNKKEGGDAALQTPLSLTGTAEELSEGFAEAVSKYSSKRQSLIEQLEATELILDAAKKDAATKASTAVKKGAGKTKPESTSSGEGDGEHEEEVETQGSPVKAGSPVVAASIPAAANIWE